MRKKCILILLDGVGDRSFPEFNHQTPLQAAHTPNLDQLAAQGACGLFHAGRQGEALPSENAHFAIFGYEPAMFPGRGPLEALGAGIDLGMDDVAVLSHFASLEARQGCLVLHNGQLPPEKDELNQLLSLVADYEHQGVEVHFEHTHKLYGIVTLKGTVAPYFTDTDPISAGRLLAEPKPLAGYEDHEATCRTVAALKSYLVDVHRKLQGHSINQARRDKGLNAIDGLVTQRAGRLKAVVPFEQRYGLRGLSLASGLVYHGLSRYLGMDSIPVEDSDDPGGDLAARLTTARDALTDYDFIHVHTKVPDEAGHTKDPQRKRRAIEALDLGLSEVLPVLSADPDLLLVLSADHATPSNGPLIHSGETVPLLFHGPGIRRDEVEQYNEVAAAAGVLGAVRGQELILMILNALDRAKLQGLMDTPVDQPYWPGQYEPFKI